ncbi:alkene reductase [Mycobacterium montefiorense]|uniref:Alkene reductase n=2 Tax=Mycobacterium montefiorense TaxID=154654 RepID=A0AA37PKA6_9MYCO|nr:alkene reductase [Mycobacterium montefiorense]GKU34564.1 alkene reductase [Mycobacterium montefiorense]GKU39185.1 alkene reductase [Mycobacterium montefiorense]GKU43610.1 alkene reductase [Mycobacterium montefiorense]GKU49950.1 alkene reductase [Mycobacterium montefiorense]
MYAPNRILMAPMTRTRAADDGVPTKLMADYYAQRATAGLIITEGTFPSARGQAYPKQPGVHTDAQQAGWARVAEAVHAAGGRIVVQLMHSGRMSHPEILGGQQPVAASAIRPAGTVHTAAGEKPLVTPHELTVHEIGSVISDFVAAACRARAAGADGVEINAANGYLLSQFLSYDANYRRDAYGGSAQDRARFPTEAIGAVADVIGPERLGLRISPGNPENHIHEPDLEAHLILAKNARELGLAYLHARVPPERPIYSWLRRRWPDRLLLNGGFGKTTSREQAVDFVKTGTADAVTVGRAYLANPDLVRRWTYGAQLNAPRNEFLYTGGAQGYTDYPSWR